MSPARDPGEVDLLHALVEHRYGDRLTAEQLQVLREGIESITALVRALRRVPLTNADEPWPPFTPYRADG